MIKAKNLKCEYLVNPIGIDIQNPCLMWNVEGAVKQSAYRIAAFCDKISVWDSGKVLSDEMRAIYRQPISSRQRIVWTVTLWDENGEQGDSAEAVFEIGLTDASDWRAKWITGNYNPKKNRRYPVDCFKKQFDSQDVYRARLYITACGLYETRLNGKRVGDFCLAPGHTDYRKRIQLQTYDVTNLIKSGSNEITLELADGWYRGSCGAWGLVNRYGKETKIIAQLELVDYGGKITYICTDETWNWSCDGTIRFADNQDGEVVEAFRTPSYSDKARATKCNVLPTAANNVAVTEHETFAVNHVIKTPRGSTVLDFGQNIAGYISFKVQAKHGQKIFLRFGETFDKDGEFTQKNIQCADKKRTKVTPLQQIEYFCKDGINEYKTKFAIFGFQYVLVETNVEWETKDFTAFAVYSNMQETMHFDCSDALINRLVANTRWSAKNNHADVPTDCPTRERHGWTGDAQIFAGTASYLFDYAAFSRKYLSDMRDSQRRNGTFRQISPNGGVDFYMNVMDGSAGWSDAGVLIPYRIYRQYGDIRILQDNYDAMKRYAMRKIKTLGKWYLTALPTGVGLKYRKYISNYGQSYGEWAEPVDVNAFKISDFVCPHPEETTAYIVYMLEHIAKIAETLGKNEDAAYYTKYADKARIGYRKLIETKKYSYDTDRQAKLVRPLYMHLLDDKQTEFAKKRLIQALDNYGWRLGTGFLSTPFILYVLQEMNIEYAYRLLENEKMPGWLFMPKMNANTIWESWEGTKAVGGVASLNHYSKGAVCEWLFDTCCGIKMGNKRNTFVIKPVSGGRLTYAKASYQSVYGLIESGWEKKEKKIVYTVSVPCNCTAEIILPNGERKNVCAGKYTF